jgi:hypothetical protein
MALPLMSRTSTFCLTQESRRSCTVDAAFQVRNAIPSQSFIGQGGQVVKEGIKPTQDVRCLGFVARLVRLDQWVVVFGSIISLLGFLLPAQGATSLTLA